MRVYLAHNYGALSWLNEIIRPQLEDLGIEITSTWLLGRHVGKQHNDYAREDLFDVSRADCLIYFALKFDGQPGCGKHIELGYALGQNKQVNIIGTETDLNSVFHYLTYYNVRRYNVFNDLMDELKTARMFKTL